MTPEQVGAIIDALEFKEQYYRARFDREPATRGGKPNKIKAALLKEIDAIADARLAFLSTKLELTE